MELQIKTEVRGDACILTLNGEVDVYTSPRLKEKLNEAIGDDCPNVIVDMQGVGFIDSSGLGVLVSALRRARERDGMVRIVCTRHNVLKILRITGLDKVFAVFASTEDALGF